MRFFLLTLLFLPSLSNAAGGWTTVLDKPMSARLQEIAKDRAKAYPALVKTAFDESQSLRLRWRALTTMGRADAVYFKKDLERALRGPQWFLRNAALIAILNAPRDTAVKWSMELVKDPALMVRTQAVRNLVGLEAKESEEFLWRELWSSRNFRKKESLWIRAHIAEALARLADRGHQKAFQRLLMDPDPRLHKWAVLGLEKSTGLKLGGSGEAVEVQRQKWLARLGVETI